MAEETSQKAEDVLIEGHTYDGIQEYDNPMPRWWVLMFWITIFWGAFYVLAISVGWINGYDQNLSKQNARIDALQASAADANPDVTPEYLESIRDDQTLIAVGQTTFTAVCAACHGDKGQGLIGPNLTDNAWLHGGSLLEIYDVVTDGVPHKGMPAWGSSLKHDQRVGVVAYIDTLRDTNVPGGKEPEGEVVEPDTAPSEEEVEDDEIEHLPETDEPVPEDSEPDPE